MNSPKIGPADPVVVGVLHRSPVLGRGLAELLASEPGVRVAGTYSSVDEAMKQSLPAESILLCDLQSAKAEGASKVMELHERLPESKILMFEVTDDDQAIIECIRAGASGCVLQGATLDEVLAAIRSLADGTPPASPRVVTSLFSYVASLQHDEQPALAPTLTPREEEILELLAEGFSNREIAGRLFLQPQTVKNYVHMVLQKMNMRSRLDVIRRLRSPKR
jgi:DNA-binding NarL/FixJ family response regulator